MATTATISMALAIATAGAVAGTALAVRRRARLSLAKHSSLGGHPRMARRVARLIPGTVHDASTFARFDGAPEDVVSLRIAGFEHIAAQQLARSPRGLAMTHEAASVLSDLQFTSRYRVPFPFGDLVRDRLAPAMFYEASDDGHWLDVDGNRLIDVAGSYGVNLFGTRFYKECLADGARRTARLGLVLGVYHPVVLDNAKRIAAIAGMDEVSFHMSGTEAVMQAVRLARYRTGRACVVRFCGAYHGWWDDVQPGPGNPLAPSHTLTLKDMSERSLSVLRTRRDIACVLVNPVQIMHPNATPPADSALVNSSRCASVDRIAYADWLRRLREVCTDRGIALIIDDVFLGFRLAPGGSQQYFDVQADLVTYGKTLGGGLPVGVVAGRRDWMRRYRDERPADVCLARGTFVAHPLVMGTMAAFLDRIDTPEVRAMYDGLDERWNGRAERMNERLAAAGLPVRVVGLSTIWTVLYTTPSAYNWMLQFYLRAHGLALSWIGTGRLIFSLDIDDDRFNVIAERFVMACHAMRDDGWWWSSGSLTNRSLSRRMIAQLMRARLARSRPATAPTGRREPRDGTN